MVNTCPLPSLSKRLNVSMSTLMSSWLHLPIFTRKNSRNSNCGKEPRWRQHEQQQ